MSDRDDDDGVDEPIEQIASLQDVDADVLTTEVWNLIDFGNARYAQPGDAIMVLLQAAAIIAAASYIKGKSVATNRESLHGILDEAIKQAERVQGVH